MEPALSAILSEFGLSLVVALTAARWLERPIRSIRSSYPPRHYSMPHSSKMPRRKRQLLSHEDVVQLLRAEIGKAGTESAWARRTGANRTSLNLALKGRVGLQKNILDALGLKKVVVVAYEPARRA